ncbi:MAG TPA: hypothetical protein VJW96_08485 [Terriglobales bacterium]|jgi:hypothetical protein|nr:hypothetical protein [Terriglobales bacterium]
MKSTLLLALVWTSISMAFAAPLGIYQHGTVVRMRMGDCMLMHRGFMNQFGPPQAAAVEESCSEYTLVADKVVYLIVGKSSNQLVPLAEVIDFRLQNKELAVRIDDARKESKFAIKEMTLRSEWERIQKHIDDRLNESSHQPVDTSIMALRSRE